MISRKPMHSTLLCLPVLSLILMALSACGQSSNAGLREDTLGQAPGSKSEESDTLMAPALKTSTAKGKPQEVGDYQAQVESFLIPFQAETPLTAGPSPLRQDSSTSPPAKGLKKEKTFLRTLARETQ